MLSMKALQSLPLEVGHTSMYPLALNDWQLPAKVGQSSCSFADISWNQWTKTEEVEFLKKAAPLSSRILELNSAAKDDE